MDANRSCNTGVQPDLDSIHNSVMAFISHPHASPRHCYFVTRVGCGLAGYHDADIAPLFATNPANCSLPYS